MTTQEIATELVRLTSQGNFRGALDTLFSQDIVSVEAGVPEGMSREVKGMEAVVGKGEWWAANHEVHTMVVEGPLVAGSHFAVTYKIDVTFKPKGRRFHMEEIGIYEVADGKVVREEFFYKV
jgi:ketosteroid isomerase-like protein